MPTNANHEAYDYAERFREKLPRHLRELREGRGLSKYALEQQSGVSHEMIGKVERGLANPTFCLTDGGSGAPGPTPCQCRGQWRDDAQPR